jgi:hypothetical protein
MGGTFVVFEVGALLARAQPLRTAAVGVRLAVTPSDGVGELTPIALGAGVGESTERTLIV